MRTIAVAPAIHCHWNWTWGSRDSSFAHWVARECAAKTRTTAAKIHCATLKRLRRVSAKNLFVYLCVPPRRGLGREGRECVEASCPAQLPSMPITRQQIVERCRQRRAVARFDQQPSLVVLNYIAQTAGVEGNHRRLAQQRFHGDESKTFIHRWNDDCAGALIERGK